MTQPTERPADDPPPDARPDPARPAADRYDADRRGAERPAPVGHDAEERAAEGRRAESHATEGCGTELPGAEGYGAGKRAAELPDAVRRGADGRRAESAAVEGRGAGPSVRAGERRADRARRVADVLRQQVRADGYADGRLPAEAALARDFGTSRNAIRDALALLAAEGLVERRRGVGTVVVGHRHPHPLHRLTGLAETLGAAGEVRNEVRLAEVVAAPAAVAARLGRTVVHLERVRHLGGVPLSLDSTYLAVDVGRRLLAADLAGRDVFGLIEEVAGQPLGTADVTVAPAVADANTAALLAVPAGAPLFAIERLSRLADGRPVDLEYLRVRGDRMTLSATLRR